MAVPLIEFEKFGDPRRWLFRRGPPPWLDDPRWYARAIRASLILGVLGSVSAGLSTISLISIRTIPSEINTIQFFFAPGLWFGLVTLIPLSRWLGRGWVFTLFSVPISILAWACGMSALLMLSPPLFTNSPTQYPGFEGFRGFFGGFVGALIVSAWMGHPLQTQAWIAGLLATTLATLSCGLTVLGFFSGDLGLANEVAAYSVLFQTFQCAVAVCLGLRLWSERPRSRRRTIWIMWLVAIGGFCVLLSMWTASLNRTPPVRPVPVVAPEQ